MKTASLPYPVVFWPGMLLAILFFSTNPTLALALPPCEQPGWFPEDFGLKDHTIFRYQETYYLLANHLSPENRFAYARSSDLCNWEALPFVLPERTPGAPDEMAIWAPFVFEEDGTYYLYFTGVTRQFTQRIMLATTTDPADADSWEVYGVVFQPDHENMVWTEDEWADCRDPMVLKFGETYYLYYSGRDTEGWIIGVATANSPFGPWQDLGATTTPTEDYIPESPAVVSFAENYYLFYNAALDEGEKYLTAPSLTGPWDAPRPLSPGWAHEVWLAPDGEWFTSYLTELVVNISPLTWDTSTSPPRPFIGSEVHHIYMPLIKVSPP